MIRELVLAAMIATSFAALAPPAASATVVRIAPPPERDEVVPEPRNGYVWVAGHWDWRNRRHEWVRGAWLRERQGYAYQQPAWVERDGRWAMERGRWNRRDRDGDGVPNRADRAPDNPNRN